MRVIGKSGHRQGTGLCGRDAAGILARRYEQEKAAWIAANPGATPRQYEAAISAICRRIGY